MTAVEPGARPYLFDARSASWRRTTGWERYTREIAFRLEATDDRVTVRQAGTEALPSRLWQDAVRVPLAVRDVSVAHFPSIPPVPWARAEHIAYTLHDLTWWKHPATSSRLGRSYYAPLAESAMRRGAHIVTDTKAVAEEVCDHFGLSPDRVTTVPLGVGLPAAPQKLNRPRPYLLTVATFEPRKNLSRLVEAFGCSGVSATHDLVVVGRTGWGPALTGIETMTALDDETLAAAYAGATAVVMPSLYEGFGLPVVEAMQLGVPVVCSDIPVLREVTGGHARFIDPLSTDSIVEALREATSSPLPLDPAIIRWSRMTWNWDKTVAALSALYRRLDGRH